MPCLDLSNCVVMPCFSYASKFKVVSAVFSEEKDGDDITPMWWMNNRVGFDLTYLVLGCTIWFPLLLFRGGRKFERMDWLYRGWMEWHLSLEKGVSASMERLL